MLKNRILFLVIFLIVFDCPVISQDLMQQNTGRIDYFSFTRNWTEKQSSKIHVIILPLDSYYQIKPALARSSVGRLQRTSEIAQENNAVAAINGSFFNRKKPYVPIGLLVIDGKILTKSLLRRTAVGIGKNNEICFGTPSFTGHVLNELTKEKIPIWGINRPRKENEAIIYTPEYGPTTRTNKSGIELIVENDIVVGISEGCSPIPENGYVISFHGWTKNFTNDLPPGSKLSINYTLTDGWDKFIHVLTAGPRLLEKGKIVVNKSLYYENFGDDLKGRNARSAIGINPYNELIMVVVEGKKKSKYQKGCTFYELAQLMLDLGATDAMGLDGGGSSSMYLYQKGLVNSPAEGTEQLVSNALIVIKEPSEK